MNCFCQCRKDMTCFIFQAEEHEDLVIIFQSCFFAFLSVAWMSRVWLLWIVCWGWTPKEKTMLPTVPGPVKQMSMEVWIALSPPGIKWLFEFFFNWLCQFCIKLRPPFHVSCYLILSSDVFVANCNRPYFLSAAFSVYIQLSRCPFLSALDEVIHPSNNWSGCRLPSNTDVSKGFQIREAYSYLLFSLSHSVSLSLSPLCASHCRCFCYSQPFHLKIRCLINLCPCTLACAFA